MKLKITVKFSSKFGQTLFISGNIAELGANDFSKAIPLHYKDASTWCAEINIDCKNEITYRYILKNEGEGVLIQPTLNTILPSSGSVITTFIIDEWNGSENFNNIFTSQPFSKIFITNIASTYKIPKTFTHKFSVHSGVLQKNECICILGSGNSLHNWKTEKPILLSYCNGLWSTYLKVKPEPIPIAYKYGVFNIKTKTFIAFEDGENRTITSKAIDDSLFYIHDSFAKINTKVWKGAGVAIPVFSLRSKNSFGTGEFEDIKLLANWANIIGLNVIQLLPVNDTTASHTNKDSYPYAAISAFALHPLYINLEKVAGDANISVIKALNKKKLQLNKKEFVDYENVMKFKLSALKELFYLQKDAFLTNESFNAFFTKNKHWLVPYAAFCYLRDKYQTADSSQWKSNNVYNEAAIKQFCSPSQKHYQEISVYYFIQYHLHLQLLEATNYAHKKGIAIKGDLPIGVYRYGADVWQEPDEFIMEEQAGAPPDDFAVKGQNWGFPTYNWKQMQEDSFGWWSKRFAQMSHYFDAFRIDHILGFFRIWSIPLKAVEGIMGRFVPAIPVHINEFFQRNISFSYHRFCKPYITEAYLIEIFKDDFEKIKQHFFDGNQLKEQYNTQQKVAAYIYNNNEYNYAQQGLFDVISNIILFDEGNGQQFHFRYGANTTNSFKNLDSHSQQQLQNLYVDYFYKRQDEFWKKEAMKKLPMLKATTNMLVCGEDLGMVPDCVPGVMQQLGIVSLEIQRMPKQLNVEFMHPNNVPYTSVITPSTHDMSTIRGWWQEDKQATQRFYNSILGHSGEATAECSSLLNEEIVKQHLFSPAMLCIFQLQDLLSNSDSLKREDPNDERINIPADPNHFWKYRIHILLEDLIKQKEFNKHLKNLILDSGRHM